MLARESVFANTGVCVFFLSTRSVCRGTEGCVSRSLMVSLCDASSRDKCGVGLRDASSPSRYACVSFSRN